MAKIFRFSGYFVDAKNEIDSAGEFENCLYYGLCDNCISVIVHQSHIEKSEEFELDGEDEPNCDLALLESHFEHIVDLTWIDRPTPKRGEVYRHFKGEYVVIMGISKHTETQEISVIYKHDGVIWNRPLEMFMGKVDKIKYPYAEQVYRFERMVKYE